MTRFVLAVFKILFTTLSLLRDSLKRFSSFGFSTVKVLPIGPVLKILAKFGIGFVQIFKLAMFPSTVIKNVDLGYPVLSIINLGLIVGLIFRMYF